jgi:hypothetical protein
LPVTYAKVRAELYRGADEPAAVGICCFDSTGQRIAVHAGDKSVSLPSFQPVNGEPIWRTGYQFLESAGVNAQLTGWGGSEQASSGKRSGLAFVATGEGGTPRGLRFIDVDLAFQQFSDGAESAMVRRAFERSFATSSQHPQRVS